MYYIYMLRCIDGTHYTGITTNIQKRLREHYYKLPACAKYTRSHSIEALDALWTADTRAAASRLEFHIKQLSKANKLKLIAASDSVHDFMPALSEDEFKSVKYMTLEKYINGEEHKNMSAKELALYAAEQFELLGEVTYRAMMGGYIFYYRGRIFGGIYPDGFLVKITEASKKYLPDAVVQAPYKGAKDMILLDDLDNSDMLCSMVREMYDELPERKSKKK